MRYCHQCHRMTAGKPLFCNHCGGSYDIKLCPRLHVNPRAAQVCSQCGSRELSSPQPKVPLPLRPVIRLLGLGPGILLLIVLCIWLAFYIHQLIQSPNGLLPLMLIGLGLSLGLWFWIKVHHAGRRR